MDNGALSRIIEQRRLKARCQSRLSEGVVLPSVVLALDGGLSREAQGHWDRGLFEESSRRRKPVQRGS